MFLTPNFTLEEMTLSQEAIRKGISNVPNPRSLQNLKALCHVLEMVRSFVGSPITISSGYRSPAVNAAVGGVVGSAHTKGLAADITCSRYSPYELAQLISSSEIPFDQLILEYDSWVHIGLSETNLRNELLTYRKGMPAMKGIIKK
jgi:hypothetical protein